MPKMKSQWRRLIRKGDELLEGSKHDTTLRQTTHIMMTNQILPRLWNAPWFSRYQSGQDCRVSQIIVQGLLEEVCHRSLQIHSPVRLWSTKKTQQWTFAGTMAMCWVHQSKVSTSYGYMILVFTVFLWIKTYSYTAFILDQSAKTICQTVTERGKKLVCAHHIVQKSMIKMDCVFQSGLKISCHRAGFFRLQGNISRFYQEYGGK